MRDVVFDERQSPTVFIMSVGHILNKFRFIVYTLYLDAFSQRQIELSNRPNTMEISQR